MKVSIDRIIQAANFDEFMAQAKRKKAREEAERKRQEAARKAKMDRLEQIRSLGLSPEQATLAALRLVCPLGEKEAQHLFALSSVDANGHWRKLVGAVEALREDGFLIEESTGSTRGIFYTLIRD